MNYKYIALGLLLSGALLAAPSFAGVTDVTGGTTSSTYKHTYHTKVDAHADMTFYHYTKVSSLTPLAVLSIMRVVLL